MQSSNHSTFTIGGQTVETTHSKLNSIRHCSLTWQGRRLNWIWRTENLCNFFKYDLYVAWNNVNKLDQTVINRFYWSELFDGVKLALWDFLKLRSSVEITAVLSSLDQQWDSCSILLFIGSDSGGSSSWKARDLTVIYVHKVMVVWRSCKLQFQVTKI